MKPSFYALGRLRTGKKNKSEVAYEQLLELRKRAGEVAWYCFEGMTFKLADDTRYTPDFPVMLADGTMEMHEVKGYWQDDAKVKVKVAAALFPFKFVIAVPQSKKNGGGFEISEI